MSAQTQESWFCADCDAPLAGKSIIRKKDGRVICERCERTIQDKLREQAQPDLFIEQNRLFNPSARRRNVQGFRDASGQFHPIRADKENYNEFLAGDFEKKERKPSLRALTKQRKEHEELERYYKDELKELKESELGKRSLTQFVRAQGGIVPGGMFAGEIKRLGYKETGTTGLINRKARQGSQKQSAEYVMDAANDEGYRDKNGQRFTRIGDFLEAVEDDAAKRMRASGGITTVRRRGVKKRRDARKMAKAMRNPVTIYFTKRFISGPLKGLDYIDQVTLESDEAVKRFIQRGKTKGIKPAGGGSTYKIVDASYQKYKRNGLVDIAAGLQAADYLKSRLTSKRKRGNPGDLCAKCRSPLDSQGYCSEQRGHCEGATNKAIAEFGSGFYDLLSPGEQWEYTNRHARSRKSGIAYALRRLRMTKRANPAPAPARFPATKTPAQVTKFERIQDVDTKERGTILGHTNGWVKVKWDNRAKSTLISPDQIRIVNGKLCCMNPSAKLSAAERKVYAKARDVYRQANKLYAEGKTKEATKLYNRADMLLKRGIASGKHTDGPIGTLPNPLSQHVQALTRMEQAEKKRFKRGVNLPYICEECGLHFKENDLVYFWPIVHIAVHRKHTGRKENPASVRAMSERFQGRASGAIQELKAANSAPANLSRAGRLVFLKLADTRKTVKIPGSIVCIDPKTEKLWIAGNRQPLLSQKAKKGERLDFGPIEQICYETAKKHIGNGKRFEYVHTFGEEGGNLPHLLVDDEGMPILRGGDYKITAAGIVD